LNAAVELGAEVGVKAACDALSVSRATLYRRRRAPSASPALRPPSHRRLSDDERQRVLEALNSERFVDLAPAEVYATLLDEGEYFCSIRTMYRVLHEQGFVRERRDQLRHPSYARPELLATAPGQLWSWDITKLKGPEKWHYFHLYVILDVYSRYVVGWMVADRESDALAERLIAETIGKERFDPELLTLHADRGASMRSKRVAQLLADLGVTKTHSRPHTSNDNPFSESHFKTLKTRPSFPTRFGSIDDARTFCRVFFPWYNQEHRHHGLALLTPHQVHHGLAEQVLQARQAALDAAYAAAPERFARPPRVPQLPAEVWINPPLPTTSRAIASNRGTSAGPENRDRIDIVAPLASSISPGGNPDTRRAVLPGPPGTAESPPRSPVYGAHMSSNGRRSRFNLHD
jgi:putative transposase